MATTASPTSSNALVAVSGNNTVISNSSAAQTQQSHQQPRPITNKPTMIAPTDRQRFEAALLQVRTRLQHQRREDILCLFLSASTLTRSIVVTQLQHMTWRVDDASRLVDAQQMIRKRLLHSIKKSADPLVRAMGIVLESGGGGSISVEAPALEANGGLMVSAPPATAATTTSKGNSSKAAGQQQQRGSDSSSISNALAPADQVKSLGGALGIPVIAAPPSATTTSSSATSITTAGTISSNNNTAHRLLRKKLPSSDYTQLVLVDALLHENYADVATEIRRIESEFGGTLILVLLTDPRPTDGLGMRPLAELVVTPQEGYAAGYDLVLPRAFDHTMAMFLTEIFLSASGRWQKLVGGGGGGGDGSSNSTVVGGGGGGGGIRNPAGADGIGGISNYNRIKYILGEVTDRVIAVDPTALSMAALINGGGGGFVGRGGGMVNGLSRNNKNNASANALSIASPSGAPAVSGYTTNRQRGGMRRADHDDHSGDDDDDELPTNTSMISSVSGVGRGTSSTSPKRGAASTTTNRTGGMGFNTSTTSSNRNAASSSSSSSSSSTAKAGMSSPGKSNQRTSPSSSSPQHQSGQPSNATSWGSKSIQQQQQLMFPTPSAAEKRALVGQCIDTNPEYIKVLARYEAALNSMRRMQDKMKVLTTSHTQLQAEHEVSQKELQSLKTKVERDKNKLFADSGRDSEGSKLAAMGFADAEAIVRELDAAKQNRIQDAGQINSLTTQIEKYRTKNTQMAAELKLLQKLKTDNARALKDLNFELEDVRDDMEGKGIGNATRTALQAENASLKERVLQMVQILNDLRDCYRGVPSQLKQQKAIEGLALLITNDIPLVLAGNGASRQPFSARRSSEFAAAQQAQEEEQQKLMAEAYARRIAMGKLQKRCEALEVALLSVNDFDVVNGGLGDAYGGTCDGGDDKKKTSTAGEDATTTTVVKSQAGSSSAGPEVTSATISPAAGIIRPPAPPQQSPQQQGGDSTSGSKSLFPSHRPSMASMPSMVGGGTHPLMLAKLTTNLTNSQYGKFAEIVTSTRVSIAGTSFLYANGTKVDKMTYTGEDGEEDDGETIGAVGDPTTNPNSSNEININATNKSTDAPSQANSNLVTFALNTSDPENNFKNSLGGAQHPPRSPSAITVLLSHSDILSHHHQVSKAPTAGDDVERIDVDFGDDASNPIVTPKKQQQQQPKTYGVGVNGGSTKSTVIKMVNITDDQLRGLWKAAKALAAGDGSGADTLDEATVFAKLKALLVMESDAPHSNAYSPPGSPKAGGGGNLNSTFPTPPATLSPQQKGFSRRTPRVADLPARSPDNEHLLLGSPAFTGLTPHALPSAVASPYFKVKK